jgi:hypothetical protein
LVPYEKRSENEVSAVAQTSSLVFGNYPLIEEHEVGWERRVAEPVLSSPGLVKSERDSGVP